jgi:hypothetical protein
MRRAVSIALLLAGSAAFAAPALTPPTGAEARAFTQRFLDFAARTRPELHLRAAGELSVQGDKPGPFLLANLWSECSTDPSICDTAMARWLRAIARPENAPFTVGDLRVALFAGEMLDGDRKLSHVLRPWISPLAQAVVINSPDTITVLSRKEAKRLGLDDDALFRKAMANLRAALPAKIEGKRLDPNAATGPVLAQFSDNYGGARLLLHERWASIAAGGTLFAAAPARDMLIWIVSPSEREAVGFRGLAQLMFAHEPHPISPAVFRWTPAAWVLEDVNQQPIR